MDDSPEELLFWETKGLLDQWAGRQVDQAMVLQQAQQQMEAAAGSSTDTSMCWLAKHVPKITKTDDPNTNKQLEKEREAMLGLIDYLMKRPALNIPTFHALVSNKIDEDIAVDDSKLDSKILDFSKVPKAFKAQLLVFLSKGTLNQIMINSMNADDAAAVDDIFYHGHADPKGVPLPCCHAGVHCLRQGVQHQN